jgi:hypothetical protein
MTMTKTEGIPESLAEVRRTALYGRVRATPAGSNVTATWEEVREIWEALRWRQATHGDVETSPPSAPLKLYGRSIVRGDGRPWTFGEVERLLDRDFVERADRETARVRRETEFPLGDPTFPGVEPERSPRLRVYLAAESAVVDLDRAGDDLLADRLREALDPVWYALTNVERAGLDARGELPRGEAIRRIREAVEEEGLPVEVIDADPATVEEVELAISTGYSPNDDVLDVEASDLRGLVPSPEFALAAAVREFLAGIEEEIGEASEVGQTALGAALTAFERATGYEPPPEAAPPPERDHPFLEILGVGSGSTESAPPPRPAGCDGCGATIPPFQEYVLADRRGRFCRACFDAAREGK